jgi:hypothetical protein
MYQCEIDNKAQKALAYAERYINDGSPSGYNLKSSLDNSTNPYSDCVNFPLMGLDLNKNDVNLTYGTLPILVKENEFYFHPLTCREIPIEEYRFYKSKVSVIPTSSGRTVMIANLKRYYIKLHFDRTLGRVNRSIPYKKALASIETSKIIETGIEKHILPKQFGMMREIGAKVFWPTSDYSCSYIIREAGYTFSEKINIEYVFPLFTLFSSDHKNEISDDTKSTQETVCKIIHKMRSNPDIFLENIVFLLVDTHFKLITELGLQYEFNAQNLLLTFNKNLVCNGIVLRDFMGVEKDFGFHNKYWPDNFLSESYKFIYTTDSTYQIRHSFSFDFKLTEYVIIPLIEALNVSITKKEKLYSAIKEKCNNWINTLPNDYLPKNCWYKHPNMLLTEERPYIEMPNPVLR